VTPFQDSTAAVAWLNTPRAIRERCGMLLAAAERGGLDHFAVDRARLEAAADYVVETIRQRYPDLDIPFHARWRHFAAGGVDRWAALAGSLAGATREEIARVRFDLAVTSVLLDAGVGPAWRYREGETGQVFRRSEGLAVASFRLFEAGAFSSDPDQPLGADAAALSALSARSLADGFQVADDNPLAGLSGRAALLRRLGEALAAAPELFGAEARVGGLFDYLSARAAGGELSAPTILEAVLRGLGPIWPGRTTLAGTALGDVWRHPAAAAADLTDGLVPLHKLSQWLVYSLIEPLQEAGVRVTGVDQLTALAEYRNGGLLIDFGVLVPKHRAVTAESHGPGDPVIVEWRALTVALLDPLCDLVRGRLGRDRDVLPLAKVLEGGTWAAGRRIAAEKRSDGAPPITLESDGTVF
jgi:hypothetical protein